MSSLLDGYGENLDNNKSSLLDVRGRVSLEKFPTAGHLLPVEKLGTY